MCFNNFFITNLCHNLFIHIHIFHSHSIQFGKLRRSHLFMLCDVKREREKLFNDFFFAVPESTYDYSLEVLICPRDSLFYFDFICIQKQTISAINEDCSQVNDLALV